MYWVKSRVPLITVVLSSDVSNSLSVPKFPIVVSLNNIEEPIIFKLTVGLPVTPIDTSLNKVSLPCTLEV